MENIPSNQFNNPWSSRNIVKIHPYLPWQLKDNCAGHHDPFNKVTIIFVYRL